MKIFNFVLLILAACFCAEAQAETCDVGSSGCSWICKTASLKPGEFRCMAVPATLLPCEIGSSVSKCGKTCTCTQTAQRKKCTVGVRGCRWSCVTRPPPHGMKQCQAFPDTPTECYPGETVTLCGTTCTCRQ